MILVKPREWVFRIAEALPESPLDLQGVRRTYRVLRAIWRSLKWHAHDVFVGDEGWDWTRGLFYVSVASLVMVVVMLL